MRPRFTYLFFAIALTACGTSPDSRPQTFEYITLEVLSPSCALVACHSISTRVNGYAFDTLDASREAMHALVTPGQPERSELYTILLSTQKIMPPDAPMADEDIALIRSWILAGAPGL